jgi:hypothetical protein
MVAKKSWVSFAVLIVLGVKIVASLLADTQLVTLLKTQIGLWELRA